MDEFLILLQAKLDEAKSIANLNGANGDIAMLQKKLDALKLQVTLDPNAAQRLADDIEKLINQKITISNINIDTNQAVKNAQQSGQQIGNALNQSVLSSINNIKKNITDTLKGISSLNANDIIKNLNLHRSSVGNDVVGQVRLLVSEVNNLGREAAKTNSDSAWEQLISKCTELGNVLDTFGKTRSFPGMEEIKKFADYFNGKTISVGYKSSGLSGTDFNTSQLNKELKDLGVRFSATKQEAIALDTIWEEMCNTTGRMDLLNITTAQDQLQTIISELQKAQSILNGEQGLIPHPNAHSDVTKYMADVERARDTVINLQNEMTALMQKESQESTTSADNVVQNEKRKQQAIQDTAKVQEQLVKNGNIIQQTNFATSFNTKDEAETYFNTLSKIVHIQEKLGENKNLNSFIVEVKNAEGAVEKLTYKYNELTGAFEYSGGSINNNSVQKQIDAINIKASRLQDTFNSLKSKYSDLNASNPIKEQTHITELENQYKKVEQAIESVKISDSATFSSMVSNAESEIKTLQRMGEEFKRAETISMRMNGSDISSGLAQAQERFQKLKANSVGFEQMTETIQKLDAAIATVGDKSSLKTFVDQLKVAEAQLDRVKAETKSISQVNKIQLLSNGGIKNDYATQIAKLESNFRALGLTQDQITEKMMNVTSSFDVLKTRINQPFNESNYQEIIDLNNKLQTELAESGNEYTRLQSATKGYVAMQQRLSKANEIEAWNQKNTAATKEVKVANDAYIASLRDLNSQMTKMQFNEIVNGFKKSENSMRLLGKLGLSLKNQMTQAMSSFSTWLSASTLIMTFISKAKNAVTELKNVNTLLTEISKTNHSLTQTDLDRIGNRGFDIASKYGKSVTDYLTGVQDMSRAGYQNAEAMAEVSTAAQGAGDMTAEIANKMVIATDKAYKLGGSVEELTRILDGVNWICDNNAVNMSELSEGMSIVGSTAASLGVDVDELTAALGTMTASTQQSGSEVARAFKAILLNIRQVSDEEEGIDAEGLTKYEKACNALGVSLKETKDGVLQTRDAMEVLKELSEEYNKLDENDIRRTDLLNSVGGKLRSTQLDALLRQWDMYENMLNQFSEGSGTMAAEAEKTANSWEGSLKRLHNTWVDTVGNIVNSDFVITITNGFNGLLSVINNVSSKLGSLGTIGLGAGITAFVKNFA